MRCDWELMEVFALAGIRVEGPDYAVELADVIAWLNLRGWRSGPPLAKLDLSKALAEGLLREVRR